MGQLLRIGPVQSLTKFAAVDLRFWPDKVFDFFGIVIPSLQMTGAELSFRVLFVTGTLPVLSNLDLRQRRCRLFDH